MARQTGFEPWDGALPPGPRRVPEAFDRAPPVAGEGRRAPLGPAFERGRRQSAGAPGAAPAPSSEARGRVESGFGAPTAARYRRWRQPFAGGRARRGGQFVGCAGRVTRFVGCSRRGGRFRFRRHRRQPAVRGQELRGGRRGGRLSRLAETDPPQEPRQCRPRGALLPAGVHARTTRRHVQPNPNRHQHHRPARHALHRPAVDLHARGRDLQRPATKPVARPGRRGGERGLHAGTQPRRCAGRARVARS